MNQDDAAFWRAKCEAAEKRVKELSALHQATTSEQRDEIEHVESEATALREESDRRLNRIGDLVSENTTLRVEMERLTAGIAKMNEIIKVEGLRIADQQVSKMAAESRLYTATELLEKAAGFLEGSAFQAWFREYSAFISTAPTEREKAVCAHGVDDEQDQYGTPVCGRCEVKS